MHETLHNYMFYSAISVHKCVISFCICLELIQSGATMLLYFSNLVIWSLVSPIGIGVGIMISMMASDEYHQLTVAVLQGGWVSVSMIRVGVGGFNAFLIKKSTQILQLDIIKQYLCLISKTSLGTPPYLPTSKFPDPPFRSNI